MFARRGLLPFVHSRAFALAGLSAALIWGGLYWAAQRAPQSGPRLEVPAPLLAAVRPGPLVPEGEFAVSIWRDGSWQTAGRLGADKYNRTQLLPLRGLPEAGPVRLRIEKHGGGGAHLDALLLNGRAPLAVLGAPLAKLSRTDNDISNAHEGPIEAEFTVPKGKRGSAVLALTGRIEPVEIGKEPVQFPVRNAKTTVTRDSAFFTYTLGANAGTLALDGELSGETLGEPLFYGWSPNGSGHPNAMIYGWAKNDAETLYVAVDFTGDNTLDGDVDYGKVYVRHPNGVREFKVTVPEQRWGTPGFTYTDKVGWQHKVYEFAIPLSELGEGAAANGQVQLAFALYGTFSLGPFTKGLAFDTEQNCFLAVYSNVAIGPSDFRFNNQLFDEEGTALDDAVEIADPVGEPVDVKVAFDPTTGRYLAVHADEYTTDNFYVRTHLREADSSATDATDLLDDVPNEYNGNGTTVDVAGNRTDGGYLVVWTYSNTDPNEGAVRAQPVAADGTVSGGTLTVDTATYGYEDVAVAYDTVNNRYLVVYVQDNSDDVSIHGRFVTAGGANDGAEFTINPGIGSGAEVVAIAFDPGNERFLVVWTDDSAGSSNIHGRLVEAAGGFATAAFDISTEASNQLSPAVAFDPVNEVYLVAFEDMRDSPARIYGQAVDADGDLVGSNEPLSASADNTATDLALAANEINGGVLLTYSLSTNPRTFQSEFIATTVQSASRNVPPGAGYALLGLTALAALLWLGQQRLPRLRPAFATASLALALHLAVIVVIACSSSSGGGGGGGAGGDDDTPTTCQLE